MFFLSREMHEMPTKVGLFSTLRQIIRLSTMKIKRTKKRDLKNRGCELHEDFFAQNSPGRAL